jgi:hypothetical protein
MSRHRRFFVPLVFVLMLLLSVGAVSARERGGTPSGTAAPRVTWSTRKVEQALTVGQPTTVTVSFTSTVDLQNVILNIPGRLARVMTVAPASFAAVPANTATQVTLTFNVPADWKGNASGVVQMRSGKRVIPTPLHVQARIPRTAQASGDQKSPNAGQSADHKPKGDKKHGGK